MKKLRPVIEWVDEIIGSVDMSLSDAQKIALAGCVTDIRKEGFEFALSTCEKVIAAARKET